jgi:hypothetical protein
MVEFCTKTMLQHMALYRFGSFWQKKKFLYSITLLTHETLLYATSSTLFKIVAERNAFSIRCHNPESTTKLLRGVPQNIFRDTAKQSKAECSTV